MDKTFVTFFPKAQDFHLFKDIGMIPYIMSKKYGYDSYIASFYGESEFPTLRYMEGLKIWTIPQNKSMISDLIGRFLGKKRIELLGNLSFIKKNAKKIDVLQIYHVHDQYVGLYAATYKHYNPKGALFLKLDINDAVADWLLRVVRNGDGGFREKLRIRQLIKNVDVVSVESTKLINDMKSIFGNKVIYLPCGCYEGDSTAADLSGKDDFFLTVGNLGKYKGTDKVIRAFSKYCQDSDWKLLLAGPMEEGIQDVIDEIIRLHPEMERRIIVKGNITDRDYLYTLYRKSKVFVLPSKAESFGIVYVEAKYNGCYEILTDTVCPCDDLVRTIMDGEIIKYEDEKALGEAMRRSMEEDICNNDNYERIRKDYLKRFSYEKTVEGVENLINNLCSSHK